MDSENRIAKEEEDSIDLLEIFGLLRRNAWIIIMCIITGALLGFTVTKYFVTPKYVASGKLIVNAKSSTVGGNDASNDMLNSATKLANTYCVIISSDTVLEAAAEQLGLDYTYEEISRLVSVEAIEDTQIMEITVTTDDVELSERICAKIMEICPEIIKRTAEAGSVNKVSDARGEKSPVSPHVMRDTVIMGLIGAVLSIAGIIVVHLFDNKINSEGDVEKYLGLSVLGVIPYYEKETANGKQTK